MNTKYMLSGFYAGVLCCFSATAVAELLVDPVAKSEVGMGDSGFIFGGGARGNIDLELESDVDVSWYAQFLMINEDYGSIKEHGGSMNFEGSIKDLSAGVMVAKTLDEDIVLYGGPELAFYSDGDMDWSETFSGTVTDKGTVSLERNNSFGLRFGAKKEFNGMIFNLNIALMNESSFSIGVNMPFDGLGN